MKFRHVLFAAVASAVLLGQVQAQQVWKIGALYPLTGSLALLGNENLHGARVAVDMINERGGVAGNKIELVVGDASTPDKAQSEAERLSSLENLRSSPAPTPAACPTPPARWSNGAAESTGKPAESPTV